MNRHLPFLAALAIGWLLFRRPKAAAKTVPPRAGSADPSELRYTQYLTDFRGPGAPLTWQEWFARNE